ncbi:MAG: hypothetical protein AB7L09_02370 [Nitrospira sp.]
MTFEVTVSMSDANYQRLADLQCLEECVQCIGRIFKRVHPDARARSRGLLTVVGDYKILVSNVFRIHELLWNVSVFFNSDRPGTILRVRVNDDFRSPLVDTFDHQEMRRLLTVLQQRLILDDLSEV